ncbi:MAG: hypothetical protein DRG78_21930 [Epsilonproteobacteria bacterium]|nr:MAG: hypothetical protein DRG78_21930 [Campylobacterota bacterium]
MDDFSDLDSKVFDGAQDEVTIKGVVDIIFLLDVTGSMGPAIIELGKSMMKFIDSIDPKLVKDYRVKLASFGDFDTDSEDIKLNISRSNTKDTKELYKDFLDVIELIKKKGGGSDLAESPLDALYKTVQDGFSNDWSERTKVIILFTDAISKDIQKDTIGMDLPNDEKNNMLAQLINENHVRTYIYAPNDKNIDQVSKVASDFVVYKVIDKGGINPIEALQKLDFVKEMETLGKEVSQPSLPF